MSGLLLTAAFVVLALTLAAAMAPLRRHHEPVRTVRLIDQAGAGDLCLHAVCRCGATRDMSGGRWSQFICRP